MKNGIKHRIIADESRYKSELIAFMLRSILSTLLLTGAVCLPIGATVSSLINRQLLFGDEDVTFVEVSPDARYISFLAPYKGIRNIWVKKIGDPYSAARPVSDERSRPVLGYFWSRDSKYLLYTQDHFGDENYNIFAIDPTAPPQHETGTPRTRNLTHSYSTHIKIYAFSNADPDIIYIGLNARDRAWHDLYRLNISTGQRVLIRLNTDRITSWVFDNRGRLRLGVRTDREGNTEILRLKPNNNKTSLLYSCNIMDRCAPLRFDHTNRHVYLLTNKGRNLLALALLDCATGGIKLVANDPRNRVDIEDALFSDVDDRLLASFYYDDYQRIKWTDHAFEKDCEWLARRLPRLEFTFPSHSSDNAMWIVDAHSDTEPGALYLFDRKNKSIVLEACTRDRIPRRDLAHMQAVHYKASDGLDIPAYLTLPNGISAKDLPLVVLPHGGPWDRDYWGYDALPQLLANRGYAVLQPNFRGSTGYGKSFLNAGNGEWGRKMQDDLVCGIKYLVGQGVVDPKRVAIVGVSYGGYAALAGVTFTPKLYAAAVAIAAPSDLVLLLNSLPKYWESQRRILYARMADPSSREGKSLLEAESPVHIANRIKTPLMLVQGARDPRVKKRNSDELVLALRDRGTPIEYLVAPDEGHGFVKPVNKLAMVAEMEKFLARYVGGREETFMSPAVAERLKEISVNPRNLVLDANSWNTTK
jgi:dipeptidyl aminopeptidase/acylaminoacyl peptidase